MKELRISGRRGGKTLAAAEAAKDAARRGENVAWATHDQSATAELLSRHGALSEVVGSHYVIPHFREPGS